MSKKVQVISIDSKEVLYSCEVAEEEKAYAYASQMEEIGIDVKIISPNVTDTLSDALGLSVENQEKFQESIFEEIHDHAGQEEEDDSCCVKYVSTELDKSKLH
jgi:hypothetical protein